MKLEDQHGERSGAPASSSSASFLTPDEYAPVPQFNTHLRCTIGTGAASLSYWSLDGFHSTETVCCAPSVYRTQCHPGHANKTVTVSVIEEFTFHWGTANNQSQLKAGCAIYQQILTCSFIVSLSGSPTTTGVH